MSLKIRVRKDKQKANGECPIFIQYSTDGKTCGFSTGVSCELKFIDEAPKDSKTYIKKTKSGHTSKNVKIKDKFEEIDDLVGKLGGKPTIEELRENYKNAEDKKNQHSNYFIPLYREYVETMFSKGSTRTAKLSVIPKIEAFNVNLMVSSINLNMIDKLKNHLKGYLMDTTIAKTLKDIKAALNFFHDRGWIEPELFYQMQVNKIKVEGYKADHLVDKTFLTKDELSILRNMDISSLNDIQLNAYERHILQAHTGLRISDIHRLRPEHVHANEIILTAKKNQKPVFIPIQTIVSDILKKHNNILPELTDPQCLVCLKQIYKMLGFDRAIRLKKAKFEKWAEDRKEDVREWQKNQHESKMDDGVVLVPLYAIAGTHMAVRTFITLADELGLSLKDVVEITGKTAKTIEKHYWGLNKESRRVSMSKFENAFN